MTPIHFRKPIATDNPFDVLVELTEQEERIYKYSKADLLAIRDAMPKVERAVRKPFAELQANGYRPVKRNNRQHHRNWTANVKHREGIDGNWRLRLNQRRSQSQQQANSEDI